MKSQLLCVLISATVVQVASAEKWEATTHECSLEFPDGSWRLQEGKEIEHGQILLTATNRKRTKDISVIRYPVAQAISVQDPQFVKGLKNGFANSGGRMVSDGYTNVNGRVAYWFTGEADANGKKISIFRYALSERAILFELATESLEGSSQNDHELLAILSSFQINAEALPAAPPSRTDALAYRIGQIIGFLLVAILCIGIVMRKARKRA